MTYLSMTMRRGLLRVRDHDGNGPIGGILWRTLKALERRGLVEQALYRRPGVHPSSTWILTAEGEQAAKEATPTYRVTAAPGSGPIASSGDAARVTAESNHARTTESN